MREIQLKDAKARLSAVVDLKAATIAGAVADRAAAKSRAPGFADIAIVPTAEARTRPADETHAPFERLCGRAVNPFVTLLEWGGNRSADVA
jgi:hypothetical protein